MKKFFLMALCLAFFLPAMANAALTASDGLANAGAGVGDCKQVRFKFTNNTGAKVRVKTVIVWGNDGAWWENIANHQIVTGDTYTTGKRRMNKLDSGKAPSKVTVKYDRWDAPNNRWAKSHQIWVNLPVCNDGKTYRFKMNCTKNGGCDLVDY